MAKRILITGGAGFIGSHLADRLLARGDSVRIFDNLDPQIHPTGKPAYLNPRAEFIHGDVRDRLAFQRALEGIDTVVHFAAAVGTGQSMYQIAKYTEVNICGLSNLLHILVETGARPKILFPGSATSYGEASHSCPSHGVFFPELRTREQLERRDWDIHCPQCGLRAEPVSIPEHAPLRPKFVYGIHKKTSEELLRSVAEAYAIPFTILRFFNVYGPRQSLTNPYTGVLAIFSSRIKNGQPPVVIEDGKESRDFISVHDVVEASMRALDMPEANSQTINVGSGRRTTILELAKLLLDIHASTLQPIVNNEFRLHDFRHSVADTKLLQRVLQFTPRVQLREGLRELVEWSRTEAHTDTFLEAYNEMRRHGIVQSPKGKSEPRVAAIILNWNGYDNTVECIEALRRSTYKNLEIVVVDNGSPNHEAARLKEQFRESITVLENKTNLGVSGGNNTGLRYALANPENSYCIVMNNDAMVAPESVAALVREAEMNPSVGMVSSRMTNYYDKNRIDTLGITLLSSGLGYNRRHESMPLFCPCSGFALYRAEALRKCADPKGNVWDESYFAYVDELDVGFRIRLIGYIAVYAKDAVAYHKEGATSGGSASDFSIFHGHRNNLWFILKDFPSQLLWKHCLRILATQLGTFILYAKRKRLGVIIRAKWASLLGLPRVLRERRHVQRLRTVPVKELSRYMVNATYRSP